MASLTHVCIWEDKNWRNITAEEAARLHPGGTVSAHSGLFMCERCGQFVLLTDSGYQVRHFRHSSAEKSKDCPDRVNGAGGYIAFRAGEHELPIRIRDITATGFDLELGFIPVPGNLLTKTLKVVVKSSARNTESFTYARERFQADSITYLAIGDMPSERYTISISGASDTITQYWPKSVQGIAPDGTLFDGKTGKKLVYDADVVVGKPYYLLKRGWGYFHRNAHVIVEDICSKRISLDTWHVYRVVANDYDEDSARFFLNYHCRLTEQPVAIQMVWPVYQENPYVLKHNDNSVILHIQGNAPSTTVFPSATKRTSHCSNGAVIELFCNCRQQMISAGRTKALQYTYFWKEPLNQVTKPPTATVIDFHGTAIEAGEYNVLPDKNILRVTIPFDGTLILKNGGVIFEKRKLQAKTATEIDSITWNTEVSVLVGLDCVWRASFKKEELTVPTTTGEIEILHRLQAYSGKQIKVPHTLGSTATYLKEYPKLRQWLYQCIRIGKMSEKAYRDFQSWVISGKIDVKERRKTDE